MANEVSKTPTTGAAPVAIMAEKSLQYLDKAANAIRDLGIWPEQQGEAPITGLLQQIASWTRPASC